MTTGAASPDTRSTPPGGTRLTDLNNDRSARTSTPDSIISPSSSGSSTSVPARAANTAAAVLHHTPSEVGSQYTGTTPARSPTTNAPDSVRTTMRWLPGNRRSGPSSPRAAAWRARRRSVAVARQLPAVSNVSMRPGAPVTSISPGLWPASHSHTPGTPQISRTDKGWAPGRVPMNPTTKRSTGSSLSSAPALVFECSGAASQGNSVTIPARRALLGERRRQSVPVLVLVGPVLLAPAERGPGDSAQIGPRPRSPDERNQRVPGRARTTRTCRNGRYLTILVRWPPNGLSLLHVFPERTAVGRRCACLAIWDSQRPERPRYRPAGRRGAGAPPPGGTERRYGCGGRRACPRMEFFIRGFPESRDLFIPGGVSATRVNSRPNFTEAGQPFGRNAFTTSRQRLYSSFNPNVDTRSSSWETKRHE